MNARIFAVPAMCLLVVLTGCTQSLSASERTWAELQVGSVARASDVLALEFVPLVAVKERDYDAIGKACANLRPAADRLETASANPPQRFIANAEASKEYGVKLRSFAEDCQTAAQAKDEAAFKALSPRLPELVPVVERIKVGYPENLTCDPLSMQESRTCKDGNA